MKHLNCFYIIFCIILMACNFTRNSSVTDKPVVPLDSIFLLSINDIDEFGEKHEFLFFLDSINNRLSVVGKYHQIISHYNIYTIHPGESIEYDNELDGHVKLLIREGLIIGSITEQGRGIQYEYDSLRHLSGIRLNKTKKLVLWKGDSVKHVVMIDSIINSHRYTKNIYYSDKERSSSYSPELLKEIINLSWDEYLFTHLGLYGKLPIGNNYIVEDLSYGYEGIIYRISNEYNENYSDNGYQIKSKKQSGGSERMRIREYEWNQPNVLALFRILKYKP